MPRTRPWEVSDEFWERVRPLIPPAPSHAKGGRPRLSDRQAFEAMVYVLRTGI
jgi:putative transposase